MNRRTILAAFLGLLTTLAVAGPAASQAEWELLGTRTVTITADQDTIPVTAAQGIFSAVGIIVRGNDLFVDSIRIVFGNGETQDVAIGTLVPQGERRVLDLVGNNRIITAIVINYQRPLNFRGETIVEIFGRR
jgi:hypothetical protein